MSNSTHLPIGYKIGGRYEILEAPNDKGDILGQGGFGIVYFVKDIEDEDKNFVIKELFLLEYSLRYRDGLTVGTNKSKAKGVFEKVKEDIKQEVETLSDIENENIVKAYGYIEENKTIYSIMEYIDGENLDNLIKTTPFNEDEVTLLLKQIINGLSEIHDINIIHRDITPSNIMMTKEDGKDVYKLIDFTTSKTYSENKTSITGIGCRGYAPPELKMTVAKIGEYSDIYSIGMTLFKLLSLKDPPSITDRYSNNDDFERDINSLNISNNLKNIIKKMTMMEAEDRFQSLEEVEEELNFDSTIKEELTFMKWFNSKFLLKDTLQVLAIISILPIIGYLGFYLYTITQSVGTPLLSKIKNPVGDNLILSSSKWNSAIYQGKRRYASHGNTVKDYYTGLIWQRKGSDDEMNWTEAQEYCENLTEDESVVWRLPSMKELVYLGDIERIGPAINTNYFDIKNSWYWSDTIFKDNENKAWNLNFSSSFEMISNKEDRKNVICIQQ